MGNIITNLTSKFSHLNFEILKIEESLFSIKSQSGKEYQIDVRVLDLSQPRRDKDIKIPKSDWNYSYLRTSILHTQLYSEKKKKIYLFILIPSSVFKNPDKRIFFDNNQDERFKHFSNWQISFFNNIIEELSKYAFDRVVGELV